MFSSGLGWAVPPDLEIAVVALLSFPRLGLGPHLHRGTARDATAASSQTFVGFPAKQDGHSHATGKYNYVWDPRDIYFRIQLLKSLNSALSRKPHIPQALKDVTFGTE